MKASRRIRIALLSLGTLALGVTVAVGLAIPAGVFADAQPLVAGLVAPNPGPVAVTACEQPSYKGWSTVKGTYDNGTGGIRIMLYEYVDAWRWNYNTRQWVRTSRGEGTQIYAWPFTTGWTWTWTQDRGWLAMECNRVLIRWDYDPPIIVT